MNEQKKCLVGHDDDSGWAWTLVIAFIVIAIVCAVIVYGGAFIGGFHSLKNYFLAFKHNVVDSNREPVAAA